MHPHLQALGVHLPGPDVPVPGGVPDAAPGARAGGAPSKRRRLAQASTCGVAAPDRRPHPAYGGSPVSSPSGLDPTPQCPSPPTPLPPSDVWEAVDAPRPP